jgi:hypothetical protein
VETALANFIVRNFAVARVVGGEREAGERLKLFQGAARAGQQVCLVDRFFQDSSSVGRERSLTGPRRLLHSPTA